MTSKVSRGVWTVLALVAVGATLAACAGARAPDPLDSAADRYLTLLSALGQRDPGSLESEGTLRPASAAVTRIPLPALAAEASALAASVGAGPAAEAPALAFRRRHLAAQLDAIAARAEQINGRTLAPADEWQRLFGLATPPARRDAGDGDGGVLAKLDALLPGPGSLTDRADAFDSSFLVSDRRLPEVFERAMQECRARTVANLALPAGESVAIYYVTNEPWSGFSRYLGNGKSRIEVNESLPLTVDRVLELACHEGYPGHHVYNTLRDTRLVQARGWREFQVMPVFSPESFESEAAASMAARMVFTDAERLAFERDVLFPLAGLDGQDADRYLGVARLREHLEHDLSAIVAAYLHGDLDFVEAGWALRDRTLMKHPLATLQFVNQYRGYSLAYTLGKAALAPRLGSDVPPPRRWDNFLGLFQAG